MENNYLVDYIKVPFRNIYCCSFREWLGETIYEYVYLKLCPENELNGKMSKPLVDESVNNDYLEAKKRIEKMLVHEEAEVKPKKKVVKKKFNKMSKIK